MKTSCAAFFMLFARPRHGRARAFPTSPLSLRSGRLTTASFPEYVLNHDEE